MKWSVKEMLKIQEIREIIRLVDQSSIEEFMYEHEGSKIKLKKKGALAAQQKVVIQEQPVQQIPAQPSVQPVVQQNEPQQPVHTEEKKEESNLHKITSPMVGTFYNSSSPEAGPYVQTGTKVKQASVVCIVEAMKLFNEIEAEVTGEIVEILVENGQLVEYGQPLFLVKPE